MADYGARYADKKLSYVDRQLKQTYLTAQKELKKKLADFNKKFEEKSRIKKQQLADGEITKEEYQNWLTGQVFIRNQWESNIRQVNKVLLDHNQQAAKIIRESKYDVFAENYNFNAYQTEKAFNVSFSLYNAESVARLILDDPQILPEWEIDKKKDYIWNYQKVNNIIKQGIIQGEGVSEITERLCRDLTTQNENKMRMFARTAITGAQNAGRQQQMKDAEDMGLEVHKQWLATLDSRTRDAHRTLDGQEVPQNKPFVVDGEEIMFPGDPTAEPYLVYNCRCTMVTIYPKYEDRTQDWREQETIDGQTYQQWKEGKKARGEVHEEIADDQFKDIKTAIRDHKGKWEYDDLHKVGGMFVDLVEKDLAPLRNEVESLNKQYEDMRVEIADMRKQINDLDAEGKYDEADEIEKKMHEIEAKRSETYHKYWADKRQYDAKAKEKVLQTLQGIRPVGGVTASNLSKYADVEYFNYQKKSTREKTLEALNYYPRAWLDASAVNEKKLTPHWTTGRAYYQHYYYYGTRAEIRFSNAISTNIHELGHRMERAVPAIRDAEQAFYEMRTAGEQLKWLGKGYRKDEKAREDHFASPYMGKDYGGSAYELVSMGFQYCFTNYDYFMKKDPDMMKWCFGLLAGV